MTEKSNKEINKLNAPIFKEIEKWEKNKANASSWLGKWYCHIRIEKAKQKLHEYR